MTRLQKMRARALATELYKARETAEPQTVPSYTEEERLAHDRDMYLSRPSRRLAGAGA